MSRKEEVPISWFLVLGGERSSKFTLWNTALQSRLRREFHRVNISKIQEILPSA